MWFIAILLIQFSSAFCCHLDKPKAETFCTVFDYIIASNGTSGVGPIYQPNLCSDLNDLKLSNWSKVKVINLVYNNASLQEIETELKEQPSCVE